MCPHGCPLSASGHPRYLPPDYEQQKAGNRTDGPGAVVRFWLPPVPASDYGLRASAEPESTHTP